MCLGHQRPSWCRPGTTGDSSGLRPLGTPGPEWKWRLENRTRWLPPRLLLVLVTIELFPTHPAHRLSRRDLRFLTYRGGSPWRRPSV